MKNNAIDVQPVLFNCPCRLCLHIVSMSYYLLYVVVVLPPLDNRAGTKLLGPSPPFVIAYLEESRV